MTWIEVVSFKKNSNVPKTLNLKFVKFKNIKIKFFKNHICVENISFELSFCFYFFDDQIHFATKIYRLAKPMCSCFTDLSGFLIQVILHQKIHREISGGIFRAIFDLRPHLVVDIFNFEPFVTRVTDMDATVKDALKFYKSWYIDVVPQ